MKQKLLDLLQKHVDKLILGVIAIASLCVLWFFVIGSPYGADYKRSNYGPGKIDAKINDAAEAVQQRINGDATVEFRKYKNNKAGQMARNISGSIKIKENVIIRMAGSETSVTEVKRFYRKPLIGAVDEVDVELIRTAVFVPTEKVEITLPYSDVETEVKDIDFVTVQGSFDVAGLYKNFKNSFVDSASAEDRDESLTEPIFAAVGLERQTLGDNGQWSQWKSVERPAIDHRKEMFDVPESTADIELAGVDLLIVKFADYDVQKDLLQPDVYDIAASNADWMTPTYHKEITDLIAKAKENEARIASGRVLPGTRGGFSEKFVDPRNVRTVRDRAGRRKVPRLLRRDRTIKDVEDDFKYIKFTEDLDLEIMRDPLVFWAHDDTVKPLSTYRYRMRIGVFNPTAGKGWFTGSDAKFKDSVVLWSDYSEVTGEIKVDPMVYFFPLKIVRGAKEAKIQVSKFYNGKWQSHEFDVRVGESIGHEIEIEEVEDEMNPRNRRKTVEEVKTIDYSSGAVLVDVVESKRSASGGRLFQEILYSENGNKTKRLGVSKRNWSKPLSKIFSDIQGQADVEVVISDVRGTTPGRTNQGINRGDPGVFDKNAKNDIQVGI